MNLRDYQLDALRCTSERHIEGVQRQLMVMATGMGKTVVFSHVPQINPGKTLVLAHREELLYQAGRKIQAANPGLYISIEQAGKYSHPDSDVILASVATIGRAGSQRIKSIKGIKNLIIDEAHHCHKPGTLIKTTSGHKLIEHIEVGDTVFAFNGKQFVEKKVTNTFAYQYSGEMYRISSIEGNTVFVTPNHKLYSNGEKVYANALNKTISTVSSMRQDVQGHSKSQVQGSSGMALHSRREEGAAQNGYGKQVSKFKIQSLFVKSNESKKSNGQRSITRENESHSSQSSKGAWGRLFSQVWQWKTRDTNRKAYSEALSFCKTRVLDFFERRRASILLQSGLCLAGQENNIRDRRFFSRLTFTQEFRQAQRRTVGNAWLDNGSSNNRKLQLRESAIGSIQTFYYTGLVYDFEVEDCHNYIANGILSSNSTASTYQNVINELGFGPEEIKLDPTKLLLGVTATPNRSDNMGLEKTFDEIVFSRNLRDAIEQGWLVDIIADRIKTNTSLDGVQVQRGDFKENQLNEAVDNDERNVAIIRGYIDHALGKKTIVFCAGVKHTMHITDMMCREGIKAEMIIGDTDPVLRKAVLNRFAEGKTKVLVGCMVFTEGFDSPDVECLIMARPTKSQTVYIQQLGRGLRPACDLPVTTTSEERKRILESSKKPALHLLDVVDNVTKHSPIMLPSLFGINPKMKLKNVPIMKAVKMIEDAKREAPNLQNDKIKDITKIEQYKTEALRVNIWDAIAIPKEVKEYSRFSWQKWDNGTYHMTLSKFETLILSENTLGQWEAAIEATGIFNEEKQEWTKSDPTLEVLGREHSIEGIFGRADRFIENNYPSLAPVILQSAKWHKDDASLKQIDLLRRYRYPVILVDGKAYLRDGMEKIPITKGLAGGLITKKLNEFKQYADRKRQTA